METLEEYVDILRTRPDEAQLLFNDLLIGVTQFFRDPKEFELLEMLLRNAGRVMTRGQLIDRIWGADYVGDTKTLDVHVKRLRAKLETDPGNPEHLLTVRGLGYKFES